MVYPNALNTQWFVESASGKELFFIIRDGEGKERLEFHLPEPMAALVVKWLSGDCENGLLTELLSLFDYDAESFALVAWDAENGAKEELDIDAAIVKNLLKLIRSAL